MKAPLIIDRSLDEWYKSINRIYLDRNFYRSLESIFLHFIEIAGSLNVAGERSRKNHIDPEHFLPKALAWFFAYCGRAGIPSVSKMIWAKFPSVCPYCHYEEHKGRFCKENDPSKSHIDWLKLQELGTQNLSKQPKTIREWQRMFNHIYPRDEQTNHTINIKRLGEECSETAEAIRVISVAPQYIISEAPDIFAWLMGFANQFDADRKVKEGAIGNSLEQNMASSYPNGCKYCGFNVCKCPAVPPETLGRIAKEAPLFDIFPDKPGLFSLDESVRFFSAAATEIRLGESVFEANKDTFRNFEQDISKITTQLNEVVQINGGVAISLASIFSKVEVMAKQGTLVQSDLDNIISYIENQPSGIKSKLSDFFINLSASGAYSAMTVALVESIKKLS